MNCPVTTNVKTRPLGRTGLQVSEIGFGTWGLGGTTGGAVAYGPADDAESLRALRQAHACGINFFDTADLYGCGHSEKLLGQAFATQRSQVVIATKAGLVDLQGAQDFSPAHIQAALTASLQRLQTDYIDVFLLHNPPLAVLNENPTLLRLLETLQRNGQIRTWGISVRSPNDGLVAVSRFGCRVIEVNFNLTDQRARQNGLLDLCAHHQTGCIIRTPLCFGFLTGQYTERTNFDPTDQRSRWTPDQRHRWAEAGRKFNAAALPLPEQTPAQLALRYCLSYPSVSTVIPGMLTVSHVQDNAGASPLGPLTSTELHRIETLYEDQKNILIDHRPLQK